MGMKYSTDKVKESPVSHFDSPDAAASANIDPELFAIDAMVDEFAAHMKTKARAQYAKGLSGWDRIDGWENPNSVNGDRCAEESDAVYAIQDRLRKHALKTDPIDCGLFSAFWWNTITP